VAVSSDPEDPPKMRAKAGVTFQVYADPDLAAITKWGVLDEGNDIALPATFIVDTTGRIVFRYIGENASDRVLLKVILKELQDLKAKAAPAGAPAAPNPAPAPQ
jgi:peroxiredoxin